MPAFRELPAQGFARYGIDGRLDTAGVDEIEAPLTASVRRGAGNVMLDLAQVPFVGSLGIRMLISTARVLQRQGRKMVLAGVQPQVLEVFEVVALGELIPIARDEEEATQLLAG